MPSKKNKKKSTSGGDTAGGGAKMQVDRLIRAVHEPKNLDLQVIGQTLSGTAYYESLLNGCAQGTGASNRQGRKTKMQALKLRFALSLSGQQDYDLIRVMVVMDRECRGTSFGSSDLLTVNTFGTAQVLSSWNFDNVPSRLKVLMDYTVPMNPLVSASATNAAWAPLLHFQEVVIPLNQVVHYYDASSGGIAGIDSNALWLFVVGTLNANESYLNFDSRVIFRDL
jgi:hypothetical protein